MSPVVTVFLQGLSRSAATAIELLGHGFGGIVVSDRFSAYNHLPSQQRQLCWAHLIRDLTAIAERSGASAAFGAQLLELQQQLFEQWHRYKGGSIDWPVLQQSCRPIRLAFETTLQQVVELGTPAHRHHHPQTTRKGCLAVPGAGLDCPSPRLGDAIPAARSLNLATQNTVA
jgi:transposase